MFGKSRETPKPKTSDIPELKLPDNLVLDNSPKEANSLAGKPKTQITPPEKEEEKETSELINSVEKISRIVSPYFIAIVGLSLYEENFFFGTILIAVGILSLLKVSPKDVAAFLEWFKEFLGFRDDEA